MKKSQISFFLVLGFFIVMIASFLFFVQTPVKKEVERLNDVNFKIINSAMDSCLKQTSDNAFFLYGFSIPTLEENIKKDFLECAEYIANEETGILIDREGYALSVTQEGSIVAVAASLLTTIDSGSLKKEILEYTYEIQLVAFESIELEGGKAKKDILVQSNDKGASLYISKGTGLSSEGGEPARIIIETMKVQDHWFLAGNFIYNITPDGLSSSQPMLLELKYSDTWMDDRASLSIAYLDEPTGNWKIIPTLVNREKNTVKALLTHFSVYGITGIEGHVPGISGQAAAFYDTEVSRLIKKEEYDYYPLAESQVYSESGIYGLDDGTIAYEKAEGTTIAGTNQPGTKKIYEFYLEEEEILEIESISPSVSAEYYEGYLIVSGQGDYSFRKTQKQEYEDFIGLPYEMSTGISYCFHDKEYSGNENYIHLGTDIKTAGRLNPACEARILDIWNKRITLNTLCSQKLGIDRSYFKSQPYDEVSYLGPGGSPITDSGVNFGNTVVLECLDSINGKKVQLLYFHMHEDNFGYIREKSGGTYPILKDENNEDLVLCPGDIIMPDKFFGYSGDTGASHGIHLHFEVRFGIPGEGGIVPRQYSIDPILLEKYYGSLTPEFYDLLLQGSSSGQSPETCDQSIYHVAGQDENFFFS